ncbi:MAG: hypothetical protein ACYSTR_02790 [Planctomycetota bacterium]|jgi:hypothetical protein
MKNCSWKIEEKKQSSADRYLKVKPGCKLFVRLIGEPVKVVKIVTHDRRYADIESEDVGRMLREKYPHKLSRVFVRYACWCIDRVDGSLKILDMPVSVAKAFANRVTIVGKKIADIAEGCDWSITTNGKKGMNVRYEAVYLNESPLTHSEIQMVEDLKSGEDGQFDLTKILKSLNFKEAEGRLFGI